MRTVSTMESFARGEIVYLTAEVRAGREIHEIGTRAEVRAVSGSVVELALGGSETAWCRAAHVVRAGERRTRTPMPPGRWPPRLRVVPG